MKRNNPEQQIQRAIVQHLHLCGVPGLEFFHPWNGGKRNIIEASIMKSCGVKAGVSDLILAHDGKTYALELKAPGGRLSNEQRQFLNNVKAAGWIVSVATGIDEALHVLGSWGLLRTQRQAA